MATTPARWSGVPSSACRSSASARPLGAVPPSRRATPAPGTPPGDRTSRCARLAPLRSPARPHLRPETSRAAGHSRNGVALDRDRHRSAFATPPPLCAPSSCRRFPSRPRCPRPGSAWRRHGFPRSHGPSERSPNRQRLTPRCGRRSRLPGAGRIVRDPTAAPAPDQPSSPPVAGGCRHGGVFAERRRAALVLAFIPTIA